MDKWPKESAVTALKSIVDMYNIAQNDIRPENFCCDTNDANIVYLIDLEDVTVVPLKDKRKRKAYMANVRRMIC
jgi:hypothetical protein